MDTNEQQSVRRDLDARLPEAEMPPSRTGSMPVTPADARAAQASSSPAPKRSPYVRKRAPRRTQEAIDDLAEDDNPIEYEHESNVTVGGGVLGDRTYRRARSEVSQLKRNSRYGQYLEVPKGRRSIFVKNERGRRRRSTLTAIVVVGILLLAAFIVWRLLSGISLG